MTLRKSTPSPGFSHCLLRAGCHDGRHRLPFGEGRLGSFEISSRWVVVDPVAACGLHRHDLPFRVQPVDAADLRVLPDQVGCVAQEQIAVGAVHHQLLSDAAELLLVLDQLPPVDAHLRC